MNKVHDATKEYLKDDIPEFDTGDTLIVSVLVREGKKERVQNFEGVVIGRRAGKSLDATFTVRKISNGIGVERIFPLHSPMISNIDVKRKGKVRRATGASHRRPYYSHVFACFSNGYSAWRLTNFHRLWLLVPPLDYPLPL